MTVTCARLCGELCRQGVAVQLVDVPEWGSARLPVELREPWFETLSKPVGGRLLLQFVLPDQVVPEPGRFTVNYTMYEATRIKPEWIASHPRSDLIVLPTESSMRAWLSSGVPAEKLRLCPLGVGDEFFREGVPPLQLWGAGGRRINDYRTRFLNISALDYRKNLGGLLSAWLKATAATDDAVLIWKLGAYNSGSKAEWQGQLEGAQSLAGKRLSEAAPVHFIYDLFPDADMPRLFAAATHYISTSLGEGWDLPMIEAAASGLRLIAPNHSAYPAYLDESVATLIPVQPIPIFEGADWWLPDESAAVQAIRDAIDGRDGAKASARERIRGRFSWEGAARRLLEVLDEADVMASRRGL